MKFLLITIITFFVVINGNAGEFSKIEQEVRETIISVFDVDREGSVLSKIDYDNDIWGIKALQFKTESCLVELSANFNNPGEWGSEPSIAWVCINKDQNGYYHGEVTDHDNL